MIGTRFQSPVLRWCPRRQRALRPACASPFDHDYDERAASSRDALGVLHFLGFTTLGRGVQSPPSRCCLHAPTIISASPLALQQCYAGGVPPSAAACCDRLGVVLGLGLGVRLDEIHAPSAPMCLTWRLRLLTGHTRTPLITANTMTTHGMPSSARSTWYYVCIGIRRSRKSVWHRGNTYPAARTTTTARAATFTTRRAKFTGAHSGNPAAPARMRRKLAGAVTGGCGTAGREAAGVF